MTIPHSEAERLIHRGIGHVEFFDLDPDQLENLDALISDLSGEGRERFSFHAPISRTGKYPHSGVTCFYLSEETDKREHSFALLAETVSAAAQWGATHVVTHLTFSPTDTRDADRAAELAADACRRMASMSGEKGVPIDIEFAAYTDAFHRPDIFLDAIDPYPELGICVDVGHTALGAAIRSRDVAGDVALLAPRARSLHLWNTLGLEHTKKFHHTPLHPDQTPEDGWLDIPRLVETVMTASPNAYVIFEYPVEDVSPDIQAGYDWIEDLVRNIQKRREAEAVNG